MIRKLLVSTHKSTACFIEYLIDINNYRFYLLRLLQYLAKTIMIMNMEDIRITNFQVPSVAKFRELQYQDLNIMDQGNSLLIMWYGIIIYSNNNNCIIMQWLKFRVIQFSFHLKIKQKVRVNAGKFIKKDLCCAALE